jgi:hypothetical protein
MVLLGILFKQVHFILNLVVWILHPCALNRSPTFRLIPIGVFETGEEKLLIRILKHITNSVKQAKCIVCWDTVLPVFPTGTGRLL